MPTNPSIIDVDRLKRNVCDDKEVLVDVYDLFCDYYPGQLTLIRDAIDTSDNGALRESAHKLKGSLSMFHANAAVRVAQTLESAGRTGELDDTHELYLRLVTSIEELCDQIDQVIAAS